MPHRRARATAPSECHTAEQCHTAALLPTRGVCRRRGRGTGEWTPERGRGRGSAGAEQPATRIAGGRGQRPEGTYAGRVVDRRDVASWLQGPTARNPVPQDYPGKRLGLPERGPGSVGRLGRRLVGILVDWSLAQLLAWLVLHVGWDRTGAASFAPLAVFGVLQVVLVSTFGYSVGHRVVGLGVLSLSGGRPGFVQVLIRTLLLCLAIPALIWDRDDRGVHDRAASTVLVRMGEPS